MSETIRSNLYTQHSSHHLSTRNNLILLLLVKHGKMWERNIHVEICVEWNAVTRPRMSSSDYTDPFLNLLIKFKFYNACAQTVCRHSLQAVCICGRNIKGRLPWYGLGGAVSLSALRVIVTDREQSDVRERCDSVSDVSVLRLFTGYVVRLAENIVSNVR